MKDVGIVVGEKPQAQPLVLNSNNVYIHTNIKELSEGLYEYHEYQMTLDEYLSKVLPIINGVIKNICEIVNLISPDNKIDFNSILLPIKEEVEE